MNLPIRPIQMPADLRSKSNGRLPASILRPITGGGTLHHIAAAAWEELVHAAAQDNIELRHVGAYRSYDQQVALFRQRYQTTPSGSKTTRRWNGTTYYLRTGVAPSATPGTSNHGWGLAIDIAHIGSGGRLDWLIDNAPRMGWSWELQSEPWHIRLVDPTQTETKPEPKKIAQALPVRDLRRGDTGSDVQKLQWALVDAGYVIEGAGNGIFGPRTEAAVRAFQADSGLAADGIVGPRTRARLGI